MSINGIIHQSNRKASTGFQVAGQSDSKAQLFPECLLYALAYILRVYHHIMCIYIYFTIFGVNYILKHIMKSLAKFVKDRRKEVNLTQEEFAERAGVALTVVRKIEQGKTNLNLEKVNLVLSMFGHELAPIKSREISK